MSLYSIINRSEQASVQIEEPRREVSTFPESSDVSYQEESCAERLGSSLAHDLQKKSPNSAESE